MKDGLGVQLEGGRPSELLSAAALEFIASLERKFGARRRELLSWRSKAGRLDFLKATEKVREGDWKIAPVPAVLLDRRVEITGPPEPKMVINALNSGANVFMADFEDASCPTWNNLIEGQEALFSAVRRTLEFEKGGKRYQLAPTTATLFVRPRGWHLSEAHVLVDGARLTAAFFDFGLFFFHNAREQLARGAGPFFYLPKMESHLEARLWNDVFVFAQDRLGIPQGSIKATVLIETLPAAFEMDEILFELKEHSAGLNCGRWDYMFSYIKKQPHALLPDRAQLSMDRGFLKAYAQKLIQTCHRRGAHAMGGMAAQIPVKDDEAKNQEAMARVRADKLREVTDGHDGTWVAHPALVPIAKEIFDAHMKGPNQLSRLREDVAVTREDLLRVPEGTRTDEGLHHNVRIGIAYLEAWLRGQGCVPLYGLMEDAATAEISRSQVWQQVSHGLVTAEKLDAVIADEMKSFSNGRFAEAAALFRSLSLSPQMEEFLTLPAYERVLQYERTQSL